MEKIEFESFRSLDDYSISGLKQSEPSSFNGRIRIRKYKITCELIDEPLKNIQQRLQKLWNECDNWHEWKSLKDEANKYNYKLEGEAGNKRRNKNG